MKRYENELETSMYTQLRIRSTFNPKIQNNRHVDMFKKLLTKDLEMLNIKKPIGQGHIKEGVKTLEKRKDLVIRPADKGGGGL